MTQSPIIRLFHVYRRYQNSTALTDVTMDIHRNEFLYITGPSGAGKTTLLKLLYMGEPISEGQILVDGMNLSRIPHRRVPQLRRKFGIIFQDYKLIESMTVFDNIAIVLEAAGCNRRFIRKKVNSVLRTVEMDQRSNAMPRTLSGGEQQRVAVARAVVGNPKIILADEPTGSLDPESAGMILKLLKAFHTHGATVIVATHDREMILNAPGRVVWLHHGRIRSTSGLSGESHQPLSARGQ
jgi:cell division transport system ATP-binding protein